MNKRVLDKLYSEVEVVWEFKDCEKQLIKDFKSEGKLLIDKKDYLGRDKGNGLRIYTFGIKKVKKH